MSYELVWAVGNAVVFGVGVLTGVFCLWDLAVKVMSDGWR